MYEVALQAAAAKLDVAKKSRNSIEKIGLCYDALEQALRGMKNEDSPFCRAELYKLCESSIELSVQAIGELCDDKCDNKKILSDNLQGATAVKKCYDSHASISSADFLPIEKPAVKFADIAGLQNVKQEIKKAIVYPLKFPQLYAYYCKKTYEGILLYGPPGCGKTAIARAAAGECGAAFLSLKIGDVLSKWFGESEKNIKSAFDVARKHQPSILFFDEIDALGARRDNDESSAAKRFVNALLVELDGISCVREKNEKILTLAATNSPWDVDPALRRPGRFSKLIFIPPPDPACRQEIFKLYIDSRPTEKIDCVKLAELTEGYSSADIVQICEEATDIPLDEALANGVQRKINMCDFLAVLEARKSSLTPWFRMARNQIKKSGEEDVFTELLAEVEKNDKYTNL